MRRSWAPVTVGALTLIVGIISFGLFKYINERMGSKQGFTVYALFHDALGLSDKSRVQAAGIRVGQIESKTLDQTTVRAKVVIRIDSNIKVYENALISKKSASLLGEFYLELDPGQPFAEVNGQKVAVPELKEGDEIKNVIEPTGVGDILNEVGSTLPILKDILRDVRTMTSGSITQAADNLNKLIANNSVVLERLLSRVDRIAANVESVTSSEAGDVKVAIRNVREITEGVKALVGTGDSQLSSTSNEIKGSLQKIQRSVDTLDRSLKNIERITGKVAEGEGTVGRLVNDDTIARNVENITEDASTFVRGVTRLQTIVGLRSEYSYLAHTFKNYISVQLMPRPDKFYLIELVDDPRGYRTQTRTIVESSAMPTTSTTTTTITQQLRFTFMFGKSLGPLTGRFGLKESTGGLGADLRLLGDRLTLSVDIFDFHSNVYPRVQGRATVAVYKDNLFVIGGIDDVLNYQRAEGGSGAFFDWFMGAQLRFNDEDLKSVLLFGGGAASSASSR